jgi:outer membrane protein assembly factor BamB
MARALLRFAVLLTVPLLAAVGIALLARLPQQSGMRATPVGVAEWPGFQGGGMLAGVATGSASDGLEPVWSASLGGPVKSSAAVGGGAVYVGSSDQSVYALDAANGTTRWTFKTDGAVDASLLLHAGVLYAGSADGALYALDARTGALRWKYPTGGRIVGGANLVTSPGGQERIVVGSSDNQLHCIDAATGERAFTVMTKGEVGAVPAVEGHRVVFGGCDGVLHVVDASDGSSLAEINVGSCMAGSVALDGAVGDLAAFVGIRENQLVGVNIAEAAVFWRFRGDFPYSSSPAIAGDRVVAGGSDGWIRALAKETGASLWGFQASGRVDGSPLIVDGRVVVGSSDGRLYLLRLSDGALLGSWDVAAAVSASPAFVAGRVYLGSEDGTMHAFRFVSPAPRNPPP